MSALPRVCYLLAALAAAGWPLSASADEGPYFAYFLGETEYSSATNGLGYDRLLICPATFRPEAEAFNFVNGVMQSELVGCSLVNIGTSSAFQCPPGRCFVSPNVVLPPVPPSPAEPSASGIAQVVASVDTSRAVLLATGVVLLFGVGVLCGQHR